MVNHDKNKTTCNASAYEQRVPRKASFLVWLLATANVRIIHCIVEVIHTLILYKTRTMDCVTCKHK